jgi:hypothetical protein
VVGGLSRMLAVAGEVGSAMAMIGDLQAGGQGQGGRSEHQRGASWGRLPWTCQAGWGWLFTQAWEF